MASVAVDTRTILLVILVAAVLVGGAYLLNPSYTRRLFGMREGFEDAAVAVVSEDANYKSQGAMDVPGETQEDLEYKRQKEKMLADRAASGAPEAAPMDSGVTVGGGDMGMAASSSGGGETVTLKESFGNLSDFEGPSQFGNAEPPAGCYPRDQLTPSELLPKDPNSIWAQQNPMGTGSLKGKNFLSAGALIGVNTVGQSLRNANYQIRSEPPNPQVPVSVFNQTTIEPDVNRRTLEIA